MIESIFVFKSTRSRQREAPLFREREQYLSYMLDQGVSKQRLRTIASMLLHVIRLMELTGPRVVDSAEIQEASQRWLKDTAHKMRRPGESSVESFTYAARNWLGFHNLIETPPACRTPDDVAVGEFVHFLTVTRGYSLETVSGYMARVRYFLKWATNRHEHLSMISLIDVDAFLSIKRTEGCRARTIASYCVALRMFFRYSEMRGWSEGRIASGIISPRISRYDGASTGPPWKDIRRMLNAGPASDPAELRARAIFSLCSIYALRRSEVVNLTLDDFDWENETFTVRRVKRGRVQQFPIQFEVGEIERHVHIVAPPSARVHAAPRRV